MSPRKDDGGDLRIIANLVAPCSKISFTSKIHQWNPSYDDSNTSSSPEWKKLFHVQRWSLWRVHAVNRQRKTVAITSPESLWFVLCQPETNVRQHPSLPSVFGTRHFTSSWISRILWSMCVDDTIVMTPPDYLHHLTIRCPVRGSLLQARVGNQRPWLIREKSVQNTPIFSGYLEFDFFIIKSKYLEAFPRHIESSSEGSGEITRYFFNMALAFWGI